MNIIDCKGLKCPQPVINTKKYFDSIEKGEAEIIVDNEVARTNILKFCQSNNLSVLVEEDQGFYHIKVSKEDCECEVMKLDVKSLIILVTSDRLGTGDDTLGATLMKSYLYALSESDTLPVDLLLLNSGVKLAAEGSEVLDSLNKLKERGVNIASCGVCLDFYGIKDKLAVGEITNMYTIIEKMNTASNTIKI
jgi:selenium metabolism protein YedF